MAAAGPHDEAGPIKVFEISRLLRGHQRGARRAEARHSTLRNALRYRYA